MTATATGRRHTPETREKIAAAGRGRMKDPAVRARISAAQKARHARNRELRALERADAMDAVAESVTWPAVTLVGLVRDRDAGGIARLLGSLDRDQRRALPVVLAAMVDDGKTPAQLLSWLDEDAAS